MLITQSKGHIASIYEVEMQGIKVNLKFTREEK